MCLGYIDTKAGQWVCEDTTLEGMGNTLSGNTTHFTAFSVLITDNGNNNGGGGDGFDLNLVAAIVVPVVFAIFVLVIVVAVVAIVVTYIVRRFKVMGKSNIINYNADSNTL